MTPEQLNELMQFILQSQSNTADRLQEMANRADEHTARFERIEASIERGEALVEANRIENQRILADLQILASVSRDLVETARIHARRLDAIQGLTP